jgi:hypothetical protein
MDECTKVGTTVNNRQCLRGSAEKVSKTVAMRRAVRRENVDVARCCQSRRSRVRVEPATLAT